MPKEYYTVATFRSKSNGSVWHRVNRDEEGNLSCTCPGWCRRVAKDGTRDCKHLRKVREQETREPRVERRRAPKRTLSREEKASLGQRRFRL